jgi:hypothetical protein
MSDWIGLAFFVGLVIVALLALSFAGKGRPPLTEEEYQRRVDEGPGLSGAAMIGLQQILEPAAKKAAEVRQDFETGHLDEEQKSGDDDGERMFEEEKI